MDQAIPAVFVGDGSLLVRCVEAWVDGGHRVVRIASADARVLDWARAQGHPIEALGLAGAAHDSAPNPAPTFEGDDYDLLWSVGWLHKLPQSLVSRARRLALNFHDGPLPRYRGLHVPAWSLLEGSRHHGISWHEIAPQIDAGRVASALAFELSPDETAYSLNTHCHEAGFEAFVGLMRDLAQERLELLPQAGAARLYRRDQRPAALATLDWRCPAHALAAQVRALDFAHMPNPLALPKVWYHGRVIAVRRARLLPGHAPAGTVTVAGPTAWQVATGDGVLALEVLAALDGEALPQLQAGQVLPPLPLGLEQALDQATPALARGEAHWREALRTMQRVDLPHPRRSGAAGPAMSSVIEIALRPPRAQMVSTDGGASQDPQGDHGDEGSLGPLPAHALAALAGWAAALGGWRLAADSTRDRDRDRDQDRDPTPVPVGIAWLDAGLAQAARAVQAFATPWVPLNIEVAPDQSFERLCDQAARQMQQARKAGPLTRDLRWRLGVQHPPLPASRALGLGMALGLDPSQPGMAVDDAPPEVCLVGRPSTTGDPGDPSGPWLWFLRFDASRWRPEDAGDATRQFEAWWWASAQRKGPLADAPLLTPEDDQPVAALAPEPVPLPFEGGIWAQIERAALRRPGAQALVWEGGAWSCADLRQRVLDLAAVLRARGVGPGERVGIGLPRSPEMVASVLAVLACGAAYLPLDPQYPPQRLRFMCEDAALRHVIALPEAADLLGLPPQALIAPVPASAHTHDPTTASRLDPLPVVHPEDLAYVIYTSGSTGQPKGVEVRQGEVVNFFAGMDGPLGAKPAGAQGPALAAAAAAADATDLPARRWLAVTSLSFDISVLELLWTLSRGDTVVLHAARSITPSLGPARQPLDFSLFYFANGAVEEEAQAYRLLLEGARFADDQGWAAVWVPERHFHAFGGPYPNPVVTCAALATLTRHTQLRAGSCVLPLHHPIRVAEDWAVVDRLSGGRVGVSFAAGWQPQDFVLAPGAYAERQQRMFDAIATVRRLWRGESVEFPGHEGQPVPVQTRPRPLQPELPVWVTAASHPRTFAEAGRRGCHVLTHLLGQSIDELATKVQVYRQAWREAGHAGQGQVALMLHAFVGEDEDAVREIARAPLKGYLRSALDLIRRADWHFPTYAAGPGLDAQPLSASEEDALLDHAFDRYWRSSALIGTPAHCLRQLQAVQDAGVDEVACLIDFGIAADTVLTHLVHLQALRLKACHGAADAIGVRQAQEAPEARSARALSIGQALITHRITHLQCTPSQAGILLADGTGRQALSQLSVLMVGGEALPAPLAARLQEAVGAQVMNMYGPTEATVWASCAPVTAVDPLAQSGGSAPLGLPLINTTLHVRTPWGQECPAGVPGELFIGGTGLARGYLGRPALTARRFIDDPLRPGRRLYRTGDEVRRHGDGRLEFLGRLDDQVKVQGHRVELGEIEAALLCEPGVREAAVVAVRDDAGQTVLQAFVTPQAGAAPQPLDLARALAAQLPEAWLPQSIALRNVLPHTPNGKVDRQALRAASAGRFRANDPVAAERLAVAPSPSAQRSRAADPAAALTETPTASLIVSPAALEPVVAQAWCRVLGRTEMPQGVNFFDVGGHSLAAIQVQRLLREMTGVEVAVIDMFRLTTVQALARHLAHQLTADGRSGGTGDPGVDEPGADEPGADEPQAPGLRTDSMRQALTQAQERARARRALRPGTQPSV